MFEPDTDALAVHPVRGSGIGVVLPELLLLEEPEAPIPDEPLPEEPLLDEVPPVSTPPPASEPLPDTVPLLPDDDALIVPDEDALLPEEAPLPLLLPLADYAAPLDPEPSPPSGPLDEVPPPSSVA